MSIPELKESVPSIPTECLWLQPSALKQLKRIKWLYWLAGVSQLALALAWQCWQWAENIIDQLGTQTAQLVIGYTFGFASLIYLIPLIINVILVIYCSASSLSLLVSGLIFTFKLKKKPCSIASYMVLLFALPTGTLVGFYALHFMSKNDRTSLTMVANIK